MNKEKMNLILHQDTITEQESLEIAEYLDTEEGKQAFSEIVESDEFFMTLSDYLDSHQEEITNYIEKKLYDLDSEWKQSILHPHSSGLKKPLEKWEIFWQEAKAADQLGHSREKSCRPDPAQAGEIYEQLTLPFVSAEDIASKPKRIPVTDYTICIGSSPHTRLDLLCNLKKKEGIDFCKYLDLSIPKKEKKRVLFEAVDRELRTHPEYYLYILSEDELHWLCRLRETGSFDYDDFGRTAVMHAMGIGLLEVIYKNENGIYIAELSMTEESEGILSLANDKKTRSFYRRMETIVERIYSILSLYGMIELGTLYDRYVLYYGNDIKRDEFQRFIYWHLRMTDALYTGVDTEYNLAYAALFEIDFPDALLTVHNEVPDIEYKMYSKQQFLQNQKRGYSAINPLWDELADFLRSKNWFPSEVDHYLGHLIGEVIDGKSATKLYEDIREALEEDLSPLDQSIIWRISMLITMHNAVAGLKGYSRREYYQLFGKYPSSLPIFDFGLYQNQQRENDSKKSPGYSIICPLYQMPDQIQMELYEIMELPLEQEASAITSLRKRYGDNIELLCLEAAAYGNRKDYDKLLSRMNRARHLADPGDYPAFDTVIDFYSAMQNSALQDFPFIESPKTDSLKKNAAKKIYPNDPCPCGSGKKYKKCCGR
mgnify:CR=1 FL=1